MSYQDIINKKKKEWQSPDMMDLASKSTGDKIPFSSPLMNFSTYGGIPRNKITEFHGTEGGGKSSTAIDICHNAIQLFKQEWETECDNMRDKIAKGKKEYAGPLEELMDRGPKKVFYLDLEHGFDTSWSSKMGIQAGDIEVMQPPDTPAEQILQTVQEIIETGEVGLVVLDSIPSLVTEAELNKKYGERTVSALAGLLTIFMRKLVPLLTRYECTFLMINQVRDNMDNPYVVNTPGGNALKFYASLRILFRRGAPVDFVGNELPASAENPAGYVINAKLIKQKTAAFDRKLGSYFLMSQSGIRPDFDYAKLAVSKYGFIKKTGGWFTICNPETGEIMTKEDGTPLKINGMVKVYDFLNSNKDYFNTLKKFIDDDIMGTAETNLAE